jgi:Flp pilus assembly protein TadG
MSAFGLSRIGLHEGGGSAVQFAIIAPVFVLILMGFFEFGRIQWARSTVQHAVNEAARFAMINTDATEGEIETYAVSRATGLIPADLTFTADLSEAGFVSILGEYEMEPFMASFLYGTFEVASTSRVPRDDSSGGGGP